MTVFWIAELGLTTPGKDAAPRAVSALLTGLNAAGSVGQAPYCLFPVLIMSPTIWAGVNVTKRWHADLFIPRCGVAEHPLTVILVTATAVIDLRGVREVAGFGDFSLPFEVFAFRILPQILGCLLFRHKHFSNLLQDP